MKERWKRQIRNRMVYNDWGLYSFVEMLEYKCVRFGKELHVHAGIENVFNSLEHTGVLHTFEHI